MRGIGEVAIHFIEAVDGNETGDPGNNKWGRVLMEWNQRGLRKKIHESNFSIDHEQVKSKNSQRPIINLNGYGQSVEQVEEEGREKKKRPKSRSKKKKKMTEEEE